MGRLPARLQGERVGADFVDFPGFGAFVGGEQNAGILDGNICQESPKKRKKDPSAASSFALASAPEDSAAGGSATTSPAPLARARMISRFVTPWAFRCT